MIAVPQTDAMFRWHQQNQEAQENARTGGGGPVMFSLNPFLRDPATGAMLSAMPLPQGGIPPVPFGGFRAKGGPVRPGRAYVVGERGPELMVPSVPGTIVPNGGSPQKPMPINPLDAHVNRINARGDQQLAENAKINDEANRQSQDNVKYWENYALSGQAERAKYAPGSAEERAANKEMELGLYYHQDAVETAQQEAAEAQKYRSLIGTGQGWKDLQSIDAYSQRAAEQRMAEMRARSFGTGGSRFVGPPAPAGSMPQTTPPGQGAPMPPMQPSTGMLVAGPGGSTKWQPGTGPGTTLPPMTAPNQMPARPPMPFGMPAMAASPMPFGNGSRIPQAPQNRPYAELAGGTGSLANRGVRQIGRSANDPTRIAEQMRRRGDPRAIMQLGQMQMGQNFARERDAVNFAQSQMMFGQQQQAMNERDARNFDQGLMMFGLQQQGMEARDAANFAQQQQLEAERRAAELAAQNEARNRQPNVSFQPIPGTDYGIPSADGRPMGTLPVNKPKSTSYAPVQGAPGLMVPTGPGADKLPPMQQVPNPGWSVTGQPKTRMEPVGGEKPPAMPKAPSGIQYTYDAAGNVTGGYYPRYNPDTGRFVITRLDLDGDGVLDAQQGGAGAGAASSSTTRQPSGFLSFLP